MLLSVGDCVESGSYRIHSRFRQVINFVQGETRLTSVVCPDIGEGPQNIVVEGVNLNRIRALFIDDQHIQMDGVSWPIQEMSRFDSRSIPSQSVFSEHRVQEVLSLLHEKIKQHAPDRSLVFLLPVRSPAFTRSCLPPVARRPRERGTPNKKFERTMAEHLIRAARAVLHDGSAEEILRMRGAGWGLTPCGDDFLVGCFAALWLWQAWSGRDCSARIEQLAQRVQAYESRGNLISDAALRLAAEGHFNVNMQWLFHVVMDVDSAGIEKAVIHLLQTGASSGADTATGFYLMLKKETGD